MDLTKIFLYNVLPKKRIFIAFIGFLISSVIITGTSILLSSMIVSSQSYFGVTDDVIVISNPEANTPFTSILPLDLISAIQYVPGVKVVSPEIMTAAVYNDQAIYYRGIDPITFWNFTDVEYIKGTPITLDDTYNVSVGERFAQRNNIDVGDFFTIYSTRADSALELRVKSIFKTATLLDDEIIGPLWIGQFLSFGNFDYISHIRVKVDLDIIRNKEKIAEMVNSKFTLRVDLSTSNKTTAYNATLYIKTFKDTTILERKFINNRTIQQILPFRMYNLQVEMNELVSNTTTILVAKNDTRVDLFLPRIERKIDFNITTDEGTPIEGAKLDITPIMDNVERENQKSVLYTNKQGLSSQILVDGTYRLEAFYNNYYIEQILEITKSKTINIILIYRQPEIYFYTPTNESTILNNAFNLKLDSSPGCSIYYYFDYNSSQTKTYFVWEPGVQKPNYIPTELEYGNHSLTVIALNEDFDGNESKNYANKTIHFFLNSSLSDSIEPSLLKNGTQIYPNQKIALSETLASITGLQYQWNQLGFKDIERDFIITPNNTGIHLLTLRTKAGKIIEEYYYIITSNPDPHGIIGEVNYQPVKTGDKIDFWCSTPNQTLYYSWNNNTALFLEEDYIPTDSLGEGLNRLYLYQMTNESWYNSSYEIWIDNTSPEITLDYDNYSNISSGEYLALQTNEDISGAYFSWDGLPYSKIFSNFIPVPLINGTRNLTLKVIDLAGNINITSFTYTIVNSSTTFTSDIFLQNEYFGNLTLQYITIKTISSFNFDNASFNLNGPISKSGYYNENMRIYLYEGNYTLNLTFHDNNLTYSRQWTFTICKSYNHSNIDPTLFQLNNTISSYYFPDFNWRVNVNDTETIFLVDSKYQLQLNYTTSDNTWIENKKIIIDTTLPIITILSPNKGINDTSFFFEINSNAVEINYSIEGSGISGIYNPYNNSEITLEKGIYTIRFSLYDSAHNYRTYNYILRTGLSYKYMNLTFIHLDVDASPLQNVSISITNPYNSSKTNLYTNENGSILFYTFEGGITVRLTYDGIEYSFSLDTEDSYNQTIYTGNAHAYFTILDQFTGEPIVNDRFIVTDKNDIVITSFTTNSEGKATCKIYFGDFTLYYKRGNDYYSFDISISNPEQNFTMELSSPKHFLTLYFKYTNGKDVENILVEVSTKFDRVIKLQTGTQSRVQALLSYEIVNITVYRTSGKIEQFQRIFTPYRVEHTIYFYSNKTTGIDLLPEASFIGEFNILLSVADEYMDQYFRGALMLTYTIAYAEIGLVVIIVAVNMYSILRNVFKESKKETKILKMIGGTTLHTFFSIITRLALLSIFASIIGYIIGYSMISFLARNNRTLFFGHVFYPEGNWQILILNAAFMLISAFISSLVISRKENDKSISI